MEHNARRNIPTAEVAEAAHCQQSLAQVQLHKTAIAIATERAGHGVSDSTYGYELL